MNLLWTSVASRRSADYRYQRHKTREKYFSLHKTFNRQPKQWHSSMAVVSAAADKKRQWPLKIFPKFSKNVVLPTFLDWKIRILSFSIKYFLFIKQWRFQISFQNFSSFFCSKVMGLESCIAISALSSRLGQVMKANVMIAFLAPSSWFCQAASQKVFHCKKGGLQFCTS